MNYTQVESLQFQGLKEQRIRIEAIKTRGLSQLVLVGLPNHCLKESRDKIKTLVSKLVFWGPMDRIIVQLSPADENKFGLHLELPIAIATLLALQEGNYTNSVKKEKIASLIYAGTLGLNGQIEESEITRVCAENYPNSFMGPPHFESLEQLWIAFQNYLTTKEGTISFNKNRASIKKITLQAKISKTIAKGRRWEKYWLSIAAIAELPVLLLGTPGVGKTHLAKWAHCLVPHPDTQTRLKMEHIWRLAGEDHCPLIPLIQPHNRSHVSEFIGMKRAQSQRPGYFSLSHGGLLVLDEFPEMNRDIREMLRNVLDQKKVERNTSTAKIEWPAHFWLIITANPCPCGYSQGEDLSRCRCPASQRLSYQAKFSGPIMDRLGVKLWLSNQENKSINMQIPFFDIEEEKLFEIIGEARMKRDTFIESQENILSKLPWIQTQREKYRAQKLLASMQALEPHKDTLAHVDNLNRFFTLEKQQIFPRI